MNTMARFPITEADFEAMYHRIASGKDCTIPVRCGYVVNGEIVDMLTWGSDKAYGLFARDGKVYSDLLWNLPTRTGSAASAA